MDGLELVPIMSPDEARVVVHGTYFKAWEQIKHQVAVVLDKPYLITVHNFRVLVVWQGLMFILQLVYLERVV